MSKRLEILEKINSGEITAEEGALELAELTKLEEHAGTSDSEISDEMKVLQMIEAGEISASEGASRLRGQAKETVTSEVDVSIETIPSDDVPRPEPGEFRKWQNWWLIPFGAGISFMVIAGMWMSSITEKTGGTNFWYYCAWFPMLLGLLVAWIGWASREAPWVHVRVDSDDTKVRVSIPIPLGITGWGLRNFGHFIPNIDETALDEIIIALEQTTNGETPLHIKVNEGDDGEQVEVFIG